MLLPLCAIIKPRVWYVLRGLRLLLRTYYTRAITTEPSSIANSNQLDMAAGGNKNPFSYKSANLSQQYFVCFFEERRRWQVCHFHWVRTFIYLKKKEFKLIMKHTMCKTRTARRVKLFDKSTFESRDSVEPKIGETRRRVIAEHCD